VSLTADEWNKRYPSGTSVDWIADDGRVLQSRTCGAAQLRPSGLVVVPLDIAHGGVPVLLDRVRPSISKEPAP